MTRSPAPPAVSSGSETATRPAGRRMTIPSDVAMEAGSSAIGSNCADAPHDPGSGEGRSGGVPQDPGSGEGRSGGVRAGVESGVAYAGGGPSPPC